MVSEAVTDDMGLIMKGIEPASQKVMFIDTWETPVSNYDPARVGDFAIDRKPIGANSILKMGEVFGYEHCFFGQEVTFTRLVQHEDSQETVWMSDTPSEVYAMWEIIARLRTEVTHRNKILIGGLGLGLLAKLASECFKNVIVIELNQEVKKLTQAYMPKNVHVVKGDFFHYLDSYGAGFDAVVCDTFKDADHFFDTEQARRWSHWTITHRTIPAFAWLVQGVFDTSRAVNRVSQINADLKDGKDATHRNGQRAC